MLLLSGMLHGRTPNIVLIVADDLGWSDLSSYGSQYYETPHVDSLARDGISFTAAYACPNCAPTRAALMSGQYAPKTGIYTVGSPNRGLAKFRKVIAPPNQTELALGEITIAEILQRAGYRTAHIGKWHLGGGAHLPTHQGFDVNIAGNASGSPRGGYFSPYKNPNLKDGPTGENLTDRLSTEAARFIAESKDVPFFLYMCFYAVHTPIQAKPELVAKWKKKPPVGGQKNPAYAAMVETMDDGVGRILTALRDNGLERTTVVFFYSDNGGVGGYHRAGVDSREITDNAPLRGGKGMLYEGGVRVPLIVRYPGVTAAGSRSDTPVINVDFYPTLAEIAQAKTDPEQDLDGTSFLPLLRGEPGPPRPPLYWHFPVYLQGRASVGAWRTTPGGAIRDGNYKLIEFFEDSRTELYNLREDISETTDLAATMPAKAAALHKKLQRWRKATGALLVEPLTP